MDNAQDTVTREQVIEWAKQAKLYNLVPSESILGRLGDFAIFARAALATPAPLSDEPVAIYQSPVTFEKWADDYGFYDTATDVHQYARACAKDAWEMATRVANYPEKPGDLVQCEHCKGWSVTAAPLANPSDKQSEAPRRSLEVMQAVSDLNSRHPSVTTASDKQEAVNQTVYKIFDDGEWVTASPRAYDMFLGKKKKMEVATPLAQSAEQDRIDAELFQRLLHARSELGRAIADPMWADHSEVTKAALKRWHRTIDEVIKGASK